MNTNEAERLLDDLIRNSCQSVDSRDVDSGIELHRASLIAIDELRSQLLPLIRAGLTLRRLESFIRCQHYMDVTILSNSKRRFNVLINNEDDDDSTFDIAVGDRETLDEAINVALGQAEAEKVHDG